MAAGGRHLSGSDAACSAVTVHQAFDFPTAAMAGRLPVAGSPAHTAAAPLAQPPMALRRRQVVTVLPPLLGLAAASAAAAPPAASAAAAFSPSPEAGAAPPALRPDSLAARISTLGDTYESQASCHRGRPSRPTFRGGCLASGRWAGVAAIHPASQPASRLRRGDTSLAVCHPGRRATSTPLLLSAGVLPACSAVLPRP